MIILLKLKHSAANLLANFSILITYENFITLGLVAAVPASAGDHDDQRDNEKELSDDHLDGKAEEKDHRGDVSLLKDMTR